MLYCYTTNLILNLLYKVHWEVQQLPDIELNSKFDIYGKCRLIDYRYINSKIITKYH